MAIDKNSKAYQWLLNKWYTDAEITQMADSVNSWKTTQQAFDEVKSQRTTTQSTPASTGGSYVYNPTSWYYEKQSTPSTTTPTTTGDEFGRNNQTSTQTTKTETPVKQQETVGSTVPEIKQEWELKPLSQDYYNQTSDEAQSKIINNLNNYRQTNPEYFRDYESFKKNFSYDARNDEQKQTLDSWYGGYQKWMELSWIPVTDLYTQYKDGQVSMNELENLRIYDPTKYAELQAQINKWNIISAYDDDKGEDGTWLSLQDMAYNTAVQMFTKFLSGDSSSGASQYFRDYEEKMESPEMLALSDQCTEVQEQMENIQSDLDSIKKSVEEEYAGTWATRSKINAIIADRSYDLQLQLRTLNSEYNKYATQYNNRMQQYQNEFNMQIQEYQINQQARQQQMNELWFAMDLMNFETNDQKQQREWDYWVKQQEYTNWNINSKDYDTRYKAALKSVQNLLSQYEWIPMQRSAEQMAQDVLKAIDNGSDLGTELTKINKQIQGKPEYKYLYNNTYWTWSSNTWFGKTIKVWDMELVEYNWQWLTADQVKEMFGKWWVWTWAAKAYDVVDPSKLNNDLRGGTWHNLGKFLLKKLKWMTGWQCGKYVNDYLEFIGMTWATNRYYDNELSTKLNSVNTYDPKEWTVAVFDYNHKSSDWINHGHVGIVTKVTADGIYVRDSNYSSDEKIQDRFIKKGSAEWENNLKWFFDPSQPPMWSSVSTEWATLDSIGAKSQLSAQDKQKAEAMLKQIKSWSMTPSDTSAARDWLIENWYGEEFNQALDKWLKVALTDTQQKQKTESLNRFNNTQTVKDFKEASTQISNLITSLNANNWVWDLAWIFQFMKVLDPSSVVREWEFKSAAKSAWYANPDALWQNYVKHGWDGTWLTQAQRWNFAELAKSIIKSQAEMYNLEYSDLKKDFANSWIDDQWLPTNYADYIIKKLDTMNTSNSSTTSDIPTSSNSFRNMTINLPTLPTIKTTVSTKDKLQSKYWLLK